jgi:thiamine-phosphate pyrophosphorylase
MTRPNAPFRQPVLCYVTDRTALQGGSQSAVDKVRAKICIVAAAGVDWIQIREKDLPTRELLTLAADAVRIAHAASDGPRVILNDRLDIALAAGADGVHLGGESIAFADVIQWCRRGNAPPEFLIGVSCHGLEEALQAERAGASYVFFGPVYDTPSKRSFGSPQGIARLTRVCEAVRIPVIAIGGVTEKNAPETFRAGAAGIAAIRLFQEPEDAGSLRSVVERLRQSETKDAQL